jgi:hypothetical protein
MRMLIDARHQEETRVAVVKGNRIEEFDFESAEHKQLKGNIYLAKVTRVEPSLQAAFVDYGGNRHGFLAFSEIHPDYYQIPKEDREALLREEAEHAAEEERLRAAEDDMAEAEDGGGLFEVDDEPMSAETVDAAAIEGDAEGEGEDEEPAPQAAEEGGSEESAAETLRRKRQNLRRRYKIQDVIRRRQVLLVQVVKEERGNKGAALTTYLSLAGRYCVLMPNTSHGGGISRKISNGGRPQAPEADHGRSRAADVDGPDRAHRRPPAHQDRDQARLRLSRKALGRDPREDAGELRPGPDLPGQRPHQAGDPRHLQSRHRRGDRRGRGRLAARPPVHEIADAEPCEARRQLCRSGAALPALRGRGRACRRCTSRSCS